MSYLRIRCDEPQWERFKSFLTDYGNIITECFERPQGENPHYHALFQLAGSSIDALKRARSRKFKTQEDMKGNKVASISECDKQEEYLEYMCKGEYAYKDQYKIYKGKSDPQVSVFNTTIFTKSVKEYHENFWKRHANDAPKKSRNFVKEVVIEFEEKYIKNEPEVLEIDEIEEKEFWVKKQLNPRDILEFVMTKFADNFKPFKNSLIKDISRLIWWRNREHYNVYFSDYSYTNMVEHMTSEIFHSRS